MKHFLMGLLFLCLASCASISTNSSSFYEERVRYKVTAIDSTRINHYHVVTFSVKKRGEGRILHESGLSPKWKIGEVYEDRLCRIHKFMYPDSIHLASNRVMISKIYEDEELLVDLSMNAEVKFYELCWDQEE